MWPYPWTHVGTPSHLGHMDRVAATMPSQAHAGAAQEAPDIGQWEGQDVPLVRPSSCNVKGGIPSSRRYLPTYLPAHLPLRLAAHARHPAQRGLVPYGPGQTGRWATLARPHCHSQHPTLPPPARPGRPSAPPRQTQPPAVTPPFLPPTLPAAPWPHSALCPPVRQGSPRRHVPQCPQTQLTRPAGHAPRLQRSRPPEPSLGDFPRLPIPPPTRRPPRRG